MELIIFCIIIVLIASFCKVYEKMGEDGWKAIIPIYNIYILNTKIQKRNPSLIAIHIVFLILLFYIEQEIIFSRYYDDEKILIMLVILLIVMLVNLIYMGILYYGIAKGFKKSKKFAIGLIFLPIIFLPILAFSEKEEFCKEIFEKKER